MILKLKSQSIEFINKFGLDIQIDYLIQELSELIQELTKYKINRFFDKNRNNFYFRNNIIKEFLDVNFTLNQLLIILRNSIDKFDEKYLNELKNLYRKNKILLRS